MAPGAPLNVEPALDAGRTVRRVLSSEGGKLETSAADGSSFVLTIPRSALLSEEEIPLTPVSNISGLPTGVTLAAAVQMSPDGLPLFEPAELTIQPARSVPADQEVTFSWRGRGEAAGARRSRGCGSDEHRWPSRASPAQSYPCAFRSCPDSDVNGQLEHALMTAQIQMVGRGSSGYLGGPTELIVDRFGHATG